MRQILIYSVLIELFICFLIGSAMLFNGEAPGWILYKIFLIFGNYFFPIVIASSVYYFIERKKGHYNLKGWSVFLRIVFMFIIIQLGLSTCAILDMIIHPEVSNLDLTVIVSNYKKEFPSTAPITILIAFAFPLLDKITAEREEEVQG